MALVVAFGTVTALKMYGQAMTHQEKVLDCRYEVHEHTEDCYEEDENGEKILICGLADYVIHVHNDDCYDQDGELVCPLEEHEPHAHDDSCWEEEEVLICGEEETEGSTEDAAVEETAETVKTADDDLDAEESGAHAESGRELSCEKKSIRMVTAVMQKGQDAGRKRMSMTAAVMKQQRRWYAKKQSIRMTTAATAKASPHWRAIRANMNMETAVMTTREV